MTQAGIVELDIHNKTKAQARVALDATLRRCGPAVYRVRVIHGFNRGTELKEMLYAEYGQGHGPIRRIAQGANPGITELVLREL